jgi:hypothetical protein
VNNHRTETALTTALEALQRGVGELLDRTLSVLPHQIQACTQASQRQGLQEAETQLVRRRALVLTRCKQNLREQADKWSRPSAHAPLGGSAELDWSSLSLVDDAAVERSVKADRLAQQLAGRCEASLSALHAQMTQLAQGTDWATSGADTTSRSSDDPPPHPLRPPVVMKCLLDALADEGVDDSAIGALVDLWATLLPEVMPPVYQGIVDALRKQGIQPAAPSVRRRAAGGPTTGGLSQQTAPGALSGDSVSPSTLQAGTASGHSSWAPHSSAGAPQDQGARVAQVLSNMFGMPSPWRDSQPGGPMSQGGPLSSSASSGAGWHAGGDAAISADFQDLLRRIALQNLSMAGAAHQADGGSANLSAGAGVSLDHGAGTAEPWTGADGLAAGFAGPLMAPNMIRAHRDELIQARGGAPLDQMIIDIVAALFDQVLSDPKVAPQMARQIARLQMPVLRVALSDTRFFSSRRHPVRRFVNRIANLSAAFDDLDDGPGLECVRRVTALVNEVVEGDFERMDLYEAKLGELETFIEGLQGGDDAQAQEIQALLGSREADLRVHQRYMQILQRELADVELPAFVRDFLTQIWSQVQVMATAREGAQSALAQRMKEAGRELVLSVQPKGHPQLRQAFLLKLPKLMKDLNEGLSLIQWPEEAKQAFFSQLLPAHAECLKAPPVHDLTQRMLEHRLNKVEKIQIPSREEAANDPLPAAMDDLTAPPTLSVVSAFTASEAAQVGLVNETAVQADEALDINLDDSTAGDPSLAELDIDLDTPAPPSRGLQLVHHIQKGMGYQMMMDGQWKKVRLTWVSEGRTFFIFTQGGMHKKTISLTARTLAKMCDSGRFRAFEQSELIERATVRARRQLAALQAGARTRDAA